MYRTYLTPENLWIVVVDGRVPYQHRMKFKRSKGAWNEEKKYWQFADDPTSLLSEINSEMESNAKLTLSSPKKCRVCKRRPRKVKLSPCECENFCAECAVKIRIAKKPCPTCKSGVKDILFPDESVYDNYRGKRSRLDVLDRHFPHDENLYLALKRLISIGRGSLYDVGYAIAYGMEWISAVKIWISSEKATELLLHANSRFDPNTSNFYKIGKMIVRYCNQPWDIDSNLARAGSCYHGNFGDTPRLGNGLNILLENRNSELPLQ